MGDKPLALRMERDKVATVNEEGETVYARLVWVRIEFITFGEVDTMNERYHAEVKIRSKWYDDGEIDEYDSTRHWNPKLYIENAMPDVKEEFKYTVTKIGDKVMVIETRKAKGWFWERIELQNFPLDVQELSITLASKYKPTKVKLVTDLLKPSCIHPEAPRTFRDQQKWKLYELVKVSEAASYDIGSLKAASVKSSISSLQKVSGSKTVDKPKFVVTTYVSRRFGNLTWS